MLLFVVIHPLIVGIDGNGRRGGGGGGGGGLVFTNKAIVLCDLVFICLFALIFAFHALS